MNEPKKKIKNQQIEQIKTEHREELKICAKKKFFFTLIRPQKNKNKKLLFFGRWFGSGFFFLYKISGDSLKFRVLFKASTALQSLIKLIYFIIRCFRILEI